MNDPLMLSAARADTEDMMPFALAKTVRPTFALGATLLFCLAQVGVGCTTPSPGSAAPDIARAGGTSTSNEPSPAPQPDDSPTELAQAEHAVEPVPLSPADAMKLAAEGGTDRLRGIEALGAPGVGGASAITLLVGLLDDDDKETEDAVRRALVGRPEDAVQPLVEALGGDAALEAARVLVELGPAGQVALPNLIGMLKQRTSYYQRTVSLIALCHLGPEAAQATPELIKLVNQAPGRVDSEHAALAVPALAALGPDAVGPILKAMRRPPLGMMLFSKLPDALAHMGAPVVPALIAALGNSSSRVRQGACDALDTLGPLAEPALTALRGVAKDDRKRDVRDAAAAAIKTIERTGFRSEPAVGCPDWDGRMAISVIQVGP